MADLEKSKVKEEVDKRLKEMYPFFHFDKFCDQYCGHSCNCRGAVPLVDAEWVHKQVLQEMRV